MPAVATLKAWLQERQYATPYHWRQRPNDEREYQLRTNVVLALAGIRTFRDVFAELGDISRAAASTGALADVSLLDIGCGDGRFTADAAEHARAVGVDRSTRAVGFARELVPKASFAAADSYRLPFRSGSFDVVTVLDVIEHIPDEYEWSTIEEARRVLRPGGTLIVSTNTDRTRCEMKHFRHYPLDRFRRLFDGFVDFRQAGLISHFPTLRFWMTAPIAWRLVADRVAVCAPESAQVIIGAARKA